MTNFLRKDLTSLTKFIGSVILCALTITACDLHETKKEETNSSILNLRHLDYLGEMVNYNGEKIRMIHIYAEAPDYKWVGDVNEGVACVDDVARAAVVYLRHFELTGDAESAEKATQLLRFVLYMQTEEGLFYNFVWSNQLDKNTTHQNSVADEMNWWAARAVWALGTGARVLAQHNPDFSLLSLAAINKTLPHIDEFLKTYPNTKTVSGFRMPTWLISGSASDASSELLMGLAAANQIAPQSAYQDAIDKISEGIAMMQYGKIKNAPYGAHISWEGGWHGWGNSQSMALAEAGKMESAIYEAGHFYPWLLVNGWLHSFELQNPASRRYYEQIAYAVRPVAVGLVRLYEATGNEDYAIMAGLAASWFTGNNVTGQEMYNASRGYGYDGINDVNVINKNSGAESTIEAVMTILEIEQHAISNKWFYAKGEAAKDLEKNGKNYRYRVFNLNRDGVTDKVAVVLNTTDSTFELMNETELNELISD